MSREARIARLVAHRARQVDLASAELERARARTRAAEESARATDEAVHAARRTAHDARTAGELADFDAHVRSLVTRRTCAAAHAEALRRAEQATRKELAEARVELKKMETLLEAIRRAADEAEVRATQRAVDERSARRGAGDATDRT